MYLDTDPWTMQGLDDVSSGSQELLEEAEAKNSRETWLWRLAGALTTAPSPDWLGVCASVLGVFMFLTGLRQLFQSILSRFASLFVALIGSQEPGSDPRRAHRLPGAMAAPPGPRARLLERPPKRRGVLQPTVLELSRGPLELWRGAEPLEHGLRGPKVDEIPSFGPKDHERR